MSKASGAFGKFMLWLFAGVLIVAVIGVALYFGLREQGMTYFVEYNGQRYWGGMNDGSLFLRTGETQEFTVKSLTSGEVEFDVKITSNSDNNIAFAYNEEYHNSYADNADTNDYSDVFGLQADTNGFSVAIPLDMTVETAIETKLGGDITLIDELSDSTAYFVITVTVDENSVNLPFTFGGQVETPVDTVTLAPPSIIF